MTVASPDEPERPDVGAVLDAAMKAMAPLREQADSQTRLLRDVLKDVTEVKALTFSVPNLSPQLDVALGAAGTAMSVEIKAVAKTANLRRALATAAAEAADQALRAYPATNVRMYLGGLSVAAKGQVADNAEFILKLVRQQPAPAEALDVPIRLLADQIGELNRQMATLSTQVGALKASRLPEMIAVLSVIFAVLSFMRDYLDDGWTGDEPALLPPHTTPTDDPTRQQPTADSQEEMESVVRERLEKLREQGTDPDQESRTIEDSGTD